LSTTPETDCHCRYEVEGPLLILMIDRPEVIINASFGIDGNLLGLQTAVLLPLKLSCLIC
jgi:hypothetical protein